MREDVTEDIQRNLLLHCDSSHAGQFVPGGVIATGVVEINGVVVVVVVVFSWRCADFAQCGFPLAIGGRHFDLLPSNHKLRPEQLLGLLAKLHLQVSLLLFQALEETLGDALEKRSKVLEINLCQCTPQNV